MGDLRYAIRSLQRTPVVTIITIASLALGIGATSALFSVTNGLLLSNLPVQQPDQLAVLLDGERKSASWTGGVWHEMEKRPDLFSGALAWQPFTANLSPSGVVDPVDAIWASSSFFRVLGVQALIGRTFDERDTAQSAGHDGLVAVISYHFWQRRFGGSREAIGSLLRINRVPFSIIGITPRGFMGPELGAKFDIALPLSAEPLVEGERSNAKNLFATRLRIMVRLRPDQTPETASASVRAVQAQIREAAMPPFRRPEDREQFLRAPLVLRAAPAGNSAARRTYGRPVLTLFAVATLILLVACGNIAGVLLARARARTRELSVRLALGCTRGRLMRLLLTEGVLVGMAGAAVGLLVAYWGSRLLIGQFSSPTASIAIDGDLNWRLVVFTVSLGLLTALLFGVLPAWRGSRSNELQLIREKRLTSSGPGIADNIAVAAQFAFALTVVVMAGLLIRSFSALVATPVGAETDRVVIARLNPARSTVAPEARALQYERFREAAAAVPGVASAACSFTVPLGGLVWTGIVEVPGGPELSAEDRTVHLNWVSPQFFATLGTPLLIGRDFDTRDRQGAPAVAIVNEAFARRLLPPGANRVGSLAILKADRGEDRHLEVIGVASDAVYRSLRDPAPPTLYVPADQARIGSMPPYSSISVRSTTGNASALIPSLSAALTPVDSDVTMTVDVMSMYVRPWLIRERVLAGLSALFAVVALLLAAMGVFGLTSYSVERRRGEIGIRLALGAAPSRVQRMVLTRAIALILAGTGVGLVTTVWGSRLLGPILYRVNAGDMTAFAAGAAALTVTGVLAAWLPARRAARLHPSSVLRDL